MLFAVDMKLTDAARGQFATTSPEASTFITLVAIPTAEMLGELAAQGKLIAGGTRAGDIWLTLIMEADSAVEIHKMVGALPMWPHMTTTVHLLTTAADRIASFIHKLATIKGQIDSAFPADIK